MQNQDAQSNILPMQLKFCFLLQMKPSSMTCTIYISVNGTNKSICGRTVDSVCTSLKYVLSFLTSDESQQYDKYYISENGTDSSMCGKTLDSA